MGKLVSKTKDSIGSILSERAALTAPGTLCQVGIKPLNPADPVIAGAHLMNEKGPIDAAHDQGYVTSACFSPNLGHAIELVF